MKKMLLAALTFGLCAAAQAAPWAHVRTMVGDREDSNYIKITNETLPLGSAAVRGEDYAAPTSEAIVLSSSTDNEIDGFGYAITYSTAYNLLRMNAADRHYLLERTFSPERGYGVSYVRMSIGACDFSSQEYTLCDTYDPDEPLKHFGLADDELHYVIPILHEILEINPNLKVIAAPWTAPAWMKVNCDLPAVPHPFYKSGSLGKDYYQVYGEYFVKFVKAMADNGITIYAVTPQNEPLNKNNNMSLYMPWEQEADFVKTGLAPAFDAAGLKTRIYLFDHNYNYDDVWGQDDYPVKALQRMGSDFAGSDLVVGAAYHNYGGDVSELADIRSKAPDMQLLFTEASIGEWNGGRNLRQRLASDMDELVIATTLNGCRGALVWNFMLDSDKGPHMSNGGCTTCYGAVDVTKAGYGKLSFNSHYYIMALASAAVKPGAKRLHTDGWWAENLSYAAFANPDGTKAILFANKGGSKRLAKVVADGVTYTVDVPANSAVSVVMGLAGEPKDEPLPPVTEYPSLMVAGSFNGWSLESAPLLQYDEGLKLYCLRDYTFPNEPYEFKLVETDTWFPQWGSSSELTPQQPSIILQRYTEKIDGWQEPPNIVSKIYGKQTMLFDQNTGQLTVKDKVEALEDISCDASEGAVEYYTLQGVKVAAPAAAGAYVVRQGTKAKIVIF